MPLTKNCGIEVRFRDGKTKRFDSVREAKLAVQNTAESATVEHVCVLEFCIAGRCINMGKAKKRRRR